MDEKIFNVDFSKCGGSFLMANFIRFYIQDTYELQPNRKYARGMYEVYSKFIQGEITLPSFKKAIKQWFDYKLGDEQLSELFQQHPEVIELSRHTICPEAMSNELKKYAESWTEDTGVSIIDTLNVSSTSLRYKMYLYQMFPDQDENLDLFLAELHYRAVSFPCVDYKNILNYFIDKYRSPDYLVSTEFQKMAQLLLTHKKNHKINGVWSLPKSMQQKYLDLLKGKLFEKEDLAA